jgi:hypothetical protein
VGESETRPGTDVSQNEGKVGDEAMRGTDRETELDGKSASTSRAGMFAAVAVDRRKALALGVGRRIACTDGHATPGKA